MKLAARLREMEKIEEVAHPTDEGERQMQIAVAFESLKNCDLYLQNIEVSQQPYSMTIDLKFFTSKPFPHTLTYEATGGLTTLNDPLVGTLGHDMLAL
jgi:hypothetical protein